MLGWKLEYGPVAKMTGPCGLEKGGPGGTGYFMSWKDHLVLGSAEQRTRDRGTGVSTV